MAGRERDEPGWERARANARLFGMAYDARWVLCNLDGGDWLYHTHTTDVNDRATQDRARGMIRGMNAAQHTPPPGAPPPQNLRDAKMHHTRVFTGLSPLRCRPKCLKHHSGEIYVEKSVYVKSAHCRPSLCVRPSQARTNAKATVATAVFWYIIII